MKRRVEIVRESLVTELHITLLHTEYKVKGTAQGKGMECRGLRDQILIGIGRGPGSLSADFDRGTHTDVHAPTCRTARIYGITTQSIFGKDLR